MCSHMYCYVFLISLIEMSVGEGEFIEEIDSK